jgi:methionyl aminopeptidase
MRTIDLDRVAETFIRDHQAEPAFKGYHGFPASLCISVNAEVVHGIPGNRELKDGDVVSIDCGVNKGGFFGDSAYSFVIGDVPAKTIELLRVTKRCLMQGVSKAVEGLRIGDISEAVQDLDRKSNV